MCLCRAKCTEFTEGNIVYRECMEMKKLLDRIFIDGLGGMAHGLFATLIIGTIIQQAGTFMG